MKHILLYGESGAGKTTLLHRLARESGRKAFGYHSLKESADENGIAKVFLHEQGKEYHCLEDNLVGIVGNAFLIYPCGFQIVLKAAPGQPFGQVDFVFGH